MSPRFRDGVVFVALLVAALILAGRAPSERILGGAVRIVYLHGASVWSSLLMFCAAALAGLAGLILRRESWHAWSVGLSRSATLFWWTSALLSLAAMETSWNGLYLAEPRWQLAVRFGIVAALLQIGVAIVRRPAVGSVTNLAFAAALILALTQAPTVLHPSSPIFSSASIAIRVHFLGLAGVLLLAAAWLAHSLRPHV